MLLYISEALNLVQRQNGSDTVGCDTHLADNRMTTKSGLRNRDRLRELNTIMLLTLLELCDFLRRIKISIITIGCIIINELKDVSYEQNKSDSILNWKIFKRKIIRHKIIKIVFKYFICKKQTAM